LCSGPRRGFYILALGSLGSNEKHLIEILKNNAAQTIAVLLMTLVILLNFYPRGFSQTETSTQKEARLTTLLLTPSIPNAQALGNESAKITLVEFGDYQCTFCKRFHVNTRELVINNFVDTGKVRFLFKDYPINDISPTNSSTLAAEASYCAADQYRYWEYHNELYDNWRGENTGWISPESLLVFAKNSGIGNVSQFSNCVGSHKYSTLVQRNYDLAVSLRLTSTPSFVILSEFKSPMVIVGSQPFQTFDYMIKNMVS
jgi:protein-disulfide isomerase